MTVDVEFSSRGGQATTRTISNITAQLNKVTEAMSGTAGAAGSLTGALETFLGQAASIGVAVAQARIQGEEESTRDLAVEVARTGIQAGVATALITGGAKAGAFVGTKIGAAIGTVIAPGIGTAIGGFIGTLAGIVASIFTSIGLEGLFSSIGLENQAEREARLAQEAALARRQRNRAAALSLRSYPGAVTF